MNNAMSNDMSDDDDKEREVDAFAKTLNEMFNSGFGDTLQAAALWFRLPEDERRALAVEVAKMGHAWARALLPYGLKLSLNFRLLPMTTAAVHVVNPFNPAPFDPTK